MANPPPPTTNWAPPIICYSVRKHKYKYHLNILADCNTRIKTGQTFTIAITIPTPTPKVVSLVTLSGTGTLTIRGAPIPQGAYAWNGSTGVRDTPMCMYASLVHDALYQMMRIEHAKGKKMMGAMERRVFRKKADKLYCNLCRKNGMGTIEVCKRSIGLGLFGRFFARSRKGTTTATQDGRLKVLRTAKAPARGIFRNVAAPPNPPAKAGIS